jgi:hypothetical protein
MFSGRRYQAPVKIHQERKRFSSVWESRTIFFEVDICGCIPIAKKVESILGVGVQPLVIEVLPTRIL